MPRFLTEFCFGDFYTRGGLTLAQRELLVLCALATIGDTAAQLPAADLETLLDWVVGLGLDPGDVVRIDVSEYAATFTMASTNTRLRGSGFAPAAAFTPIAFSSPSTRARM